MASERIHNRLDMVETKDKKPVTVRFADPAEAEAICQIGTADPSFEVSPLIRFYERSEVEEWARDRQNNLMLVAEAGDQLVGFLFCKIMSQHWAMLDNFYVRPPYRHPSIPVALSEFLTGELERRGISYLTCLVREDHVALARLLEARGFAPTHKYTWFEQFL
jgi:ribosomal protein S18 acetylase RimI-like enzyme